MFQKPLLDKGKVAFAALILTFFSGAVLAGFLALGVGNPTRAGDMFIELTMPPAEETRPHNRSIYVFRIVNKTKRVTLEASAINESINGSSWGFLIASSASSVTLLVDNWGYISTVAGLSPQWRPFVHAQPKRNKLYLHLDGEGWATYRINDEIAWEGEIDAGVRAISVILYDQPRLTWEYIRVYGEAS